MSIETRLQRLEGEAAARAKVWPTYYCPPQKPVDDGADRVPHACDGEPPAVPTEPVTHNGTK
ncbi:hypothetical protein [Limnoglobus roseus]|uniref:Uncharacterized protein n=1 Tax=Limnoglobus roseus TaxID=2598579 RepID=A0A5C1AH12_9BACT|nr:hypothetical protein [Limnoglobus roseus]QEL17447.1 hypothetical protein PX52LOC_04436 [Limnoglobus roseus]